MSTATELREQAEAIAAAQPDVDGSWLPIQRQLALVAEKVREVRKSGHNSSQNFNFRGIDAVVNAVGPAFRSHGIVCVPMVEDIRMEPMPLSGGKQATRVLVTVRYRFHGPAGDYLDAVSVGEAFDMGDKATAKAMSVAYRTCLLQALTIPTDDPDPDEHTYEQAPAAPPVPGFRQSLTDATAKLTDAERELLRAWLVEEGLPDRPSKMNEAQATRTVDWILNGLPAAPDGGGEK